eukprot:TRINITY_DN24964_c0_g3_i1.p1 TRINITY_DN24964_c0_g3~~TRINITY_DN24964_c0_g3_i1.p1  ORF type:complete len:569 (+),score=86.83 TRINITY_DN24964_c0_g3_i1:221-1708(+)
MKPWTAKSRCSVALLLNQNGVVPSFMVSHAWGEDIEELEQAIDSCFVERNVILDKDPVIWICFLALYQAAVDDNQTFPGPTIRAQIDRAPFESVIGLRRQGAPLTMIAVHTTREDIYRRLWCPKELFQAIGERVDVWMAASPTYRHSLLDTFRYWRSMAACEEDAVHLWSRSGPSQTGLSLAVDTEAARCSSVDDEERIRREIEGSHGGYAHLDDVVLSLRKRETLACASRSNVVTTRSVVSVVVRLLKMAGFNAAALRESGYKASDLKAEGFALSELTVGGYAAMELKSAGFQASEFLLAGYKARELKSAGFDVSELKAAGYVARELKFAGYEASELLLVGFTPRELIPAGFAASKLKAAGYDAREVYLAGLEAAELKAASYWGRELKSAGFVASELKRAGFGVQELISAGFEASVLKAAGYDVRELKSAGFEASSLKAAGYVARELESAGFQASELKAAGYRGREVRSTGFGIFQLKRRITRRASSVPQALRL